MTGAGATPAHVSRATPPTLQQLFSKTPQAESSGEIDSITDDEDTAAGKDSRPGAASAASRSQEQRQTPRTSPLAGWSCRGVLTASTGFFVCALYKRVTCT